MKPNVIVVIAFMLMAVMVLVVPFAKADTFIASSSAVTSTSGSLTFDWQQYAVGSGTWSDYQPLSLTFSGLPLPSGASITSATLQLMLSGSGQVDPNVSRTESDYQYVSGQSPIYQWVCFHYGIFGCTSGGNVIVGYTPIYSTGYGGTAMIWANYGAQLTSISSGLTSAPVGGSGMYDLLAMGFGNDLQSGNPLNVSGNAYLNLQANILNFGYQSSTTYNASASQAGALFGVLTVDYRVPDPIVPNDSPLPEPASLFMLGTGLIGLAGIWRKNIRH